MEMSSRLAEVRYSTEGPQPVVELIVPHGTHMAELFKVQETISRELLPRITPRGCQTCTSGAHLIIRERLIDVVQVEIGTGKIVGTGPAEGPVAR